MRNSGCFFKFKGSWFDNPRATSYLPNDDYAAAQQELQEDALYTIPGYIPEYGSNACRVSWFFDNEFNQNVWDISKEVLIGYDYLEVLSN